MILRSIDGILFTFPPQAAWKAAVHVGRPTCTASILLAGVGGLAPACMFRLEKTVME